MLQAETDEEFDEAKEKLKLRNCGQFIKLYTRTLLLTNRRPYLDQLVT